MSDQALAVGLASAGLRTLSFKEKVAYGFGDFGNGFMFDLGQAYLLFFFTQVAGITPLAAAGVFAFTKIFDAFMDPVAGTFVDGRRKIGRHGRFKGVMMYASIALGVLTVVTFLTPHAGHTVNLIYAYVSYAAWGVLYSFTNVPYGSLASVMTQDPDQRARLAVFPQAGSVTALLVTGVAFLPIVVAVSGGAGHELSRTGSAAAAAAMAVLMTIFSISAYNIMPAMMAYFAQDNLGNVELLSVINFFSIGASIIAIFSFPFLVKKLGKRNTALLGFTIAAVAAGINFVVPTNLYLFTALYALAFIGVALPNGVTWAMVSDVIDYGDWRTGVRREGITYSMFNFSRKLAQALAAALAGVGLSQIGGVKDFDKTLSPQQADSVRGGIKGLLTLYPCIALVLAALTLLLLYPLTELKLKDMLNDMYRRDADELKTGDLPEDAQLDGLAPTRCGTPSRPTLPP